MSSEGASDQTPDGRAPRAHGAIAGNVAWRLAATAVRIVVGFGSVSVYTRVLGMEQWGLLALFLAATAPLAMFELGAGAAAVKYVSEWVGRGVPDGAVRVVHTTLLFNLLVAAAGILALNLAAPALASSVFAIPEASRPLAVLGFRVASLTWATALVMTVFLGVLAAHQRFDQVSLVSTGNAVVSAVAGIAAAWAGGSVVTVLAVQGLTSATAAALAWVLAGRLLPGIRARPRWDREAFHRSFSFGVWQAVSMAGGLLASWSDRYILGSTVGPAVVGVYAVALTLEAQLYATFHDLGEVLFPAVSHRQGAGDLPDARRLALLAGWSLSTVFGVGVTVLGAVGGDFLALWISPDTARQATPVLRVLCVAGLLGMAVTGPYYYMLGTARTRWAAALAVTSGAATFATGLALVGPLGLVGVGVGACAGAAIQWLLTLLAWRFAFAEDTRLGTFAAQVWAPPAVSAVLLWAGIALHDARPHAPSWPGILGEAAVALAAAAGAQLLAAELLPGGAARRRAVWSSFAPILRAARDRAARRHA